jgi:hypothetical protein
MQVTRQRRRRDPNALARRYGRLGRRTRLVIACAAALAVAGTGSGIVLAATTGLGNEQADHTYNGGLVLPDDQVIKPIGDRLVISSGKIMTSAVSPDGTHLAALTADGAASLTIVDLKNWTVQQLVGTSSTDNLQINDSSVGQQGPAYSPDGSTLWVPVLNGYDRYPVNADGTVSAPTVISIPAGWLSARAVGAGRILGRRIHRVRRHQRPEPRGCDRRGNRCPRAELAGGNRSARHRAHRRQAVCQQ